MWGWAGMNLPICGRRKQSRRVEAGLPSRTGVHRIASLMPPELAARTVSGVEAARRRGDKRLKEAPEKLPG